MRAKQATFAPMETISPILVAFGQAVKQQRRTRGITQEELASRCQLDRSYISHIERGLKNPTLSVIWMIANELEIRLTTLMEQTLEHHVAIKAPESSHDQNQP